MPVFKKADTVVLKSAVQCHPEGSKYAIEDFARSPSPGYGNPMTLIRLLNGPKSGDKIWQNINNLQHA